MAFAPLHEYSPTLAHWETHSLLAEEGDPTGLVAGQYVLLEPAPKLLAWAHGSFASPPPEHRCPVRASPDAPISVARLTHSAGATPSFHGIGYALQVEMLDEVTQAAWRDAREFEEGGREEATAECEQSRLPPSPTVKCLSRDTHGREER